MLFEVLLVVTCIPVLACSGYLFGLTLLSARQRARGVPPPTTRFVAVIPAHDERLNIAGTVESLLSADYPELLRRVLVVADNCTDDTADRAREAGAEVLVRDDASKRGKGYALAAAFQRVLEQGDADAVVVVDADTRVTSNLLLAFAGRLQSGAHAVQAGNAVGNPGASWRTRLMTIAFALFNGLRSLARDRARVSCGLRGNGMALSTSILREVPYDAFSLVEDLEYGVRLGQAGHRVWYAGEATVLSEMVTTERASRSQRRRWEEGRRRLARAVAPRLVLDGLLKRSLLELDLAADLLVPPLSFLCLVALAGLATSGGAWVRGYVGWQPMVAWGACAVMLMSYVARGVFLSGAGLRGFVDLATAPAYVAWKLALRFRGQRKDGGWVRTSREGEAKP
jgi:1,2-diacylglycerol 3-beta-glucosyltransferase